MNGLVYASTHAQLYCSAAVYSFACYSTGSN